MSEQGGGGENLPRGTITKLTQDAERMAGKMPKTDLRENLTRLPEVPGRPVRATDQRPEAPDFSRVTGTPANLETKRVDPTKVVGSPNYKGNQ